MNSASVFQSGKLIVVAGSRGGAGTSCLAASIAQALTSQTAAAARYNRQGSHGIGRCVLVDLCGGAAGLEVLLGIENEPGARWPEMAAARGDVDGTELVLALPQWLNVPVLSVSRHHPDALSDEVVLDVCAGLLRNGWLVVLDIPGPAAWTAAIQALVADADQVLLATPDSTVGLSGAIATAAAFEPLISRAGKCGIALRSRRGSRIGKSQVENLVGFPVKVRYREDRNLATAIELGAGPVSKAAKQLMKAGQAIAAEVMG